MDGTSRWSGRGSVAKRKLKGAIAAKLWMGEIDCRVDG
jgi:hypothetical protein